MNIRPMIIRRSQIQSTIDKSVEIAEKGRDDYWENELELQLARKESEHVLELSESNAKIKSQGRTIERLNEKIKDADRKYHQGRAMIKKAKYVAQTIREEHDCIMEQGQKQNQRFTALEFEIEESDELLIESK